MGTRSRIGVQHPDGTIEHVYCHYDGYPSSVGCRLYRYYYTEAKAQELVSLGSLNNVGYYIGVQHGTEDRFRHPHCMCCSFDHRDGGREWEQCQAETAKDYAEFLTQRGWNDYYYIMRRGVWYVGSSYEREGMVKDGLVPLGPLLQTDKDCVESMAAIDEMERKLREAQGGQGDAVMDTD
ncbi:hypothetical protein KIPB_009361 [Kipferlia bialata]|uniref:Uncharacterized protein n=1 Tax=Kipferlia bialata TaxID=797122 RepID=A0A391NVX1_9EUKA|nr:hypothetical protein KIPB_009361 [Kipferlia bialata]|eukprot:g9361.t1